MEVDGSIGLLPVPVEHGLMEWQSKKGQEGSGASGGRMQRVGSQNTTIPCTKNADFQTLLYQNMGACQNTRYIRAIQLMINILSMTGIT